jgi:glycyl-tRNA synthetase beta chain
LQVPRKEKIMKKKKGTATSVAGSGKPINALLEIGLEEMPSRFMPALLADLKEKAAKELEALRLTSKSVRTYGTPRRLVLYIEGLPIKQDDVINEVRGPAKEHAFNGSGQPTKAAEGFAKSQGVQTLHLKLKKIGEKEFVFASVMDKGMETDKILSELFPKLIKSLYLPISMRWGDVDFRFIRPIHWIFAVCGSKTLNFKIAEIISSNKTCGHRYYSPEPVAIKTEKGIDIAVFKAALLKGKVVLDQEERRKKIAEMVKSAAKKAGGEAIIDKDLLEEINHLVEWPVAIIGKFKKEYLSLPKDVLVTSMKKNQKYFSVVDSSEKLLPLFINITNALAQSDMKNVVEGNERVLAARLADAQFFFNEDRKKLLSDLIPNLTKVAFYEKLGTIYEKVERITALSEWTAKELKLAASQKENIKEIAKLCKADLLTQMVYEFPSLQGVMGREYSLLEGRPKEIANGIFEHYLPRHSEDILPASIEGAVISIADKIDSIVGCFSIGLIPTGSEDPFSLRRQAHGIVCILMKKKINLELDALIEKAYKLYGPLFLGEMFSSGKVKYNDESKVIKDVLAFLAARLKGFLLEENISYDVADAALSNLRDVLDAYQKAKVISKHIKEEWLKGVVFTADRITRLAVHATRENVIESDFVTDDERSIYRLFLDVNSAITDALQKNNYDAAVKEFSKMTKPVDDFFVKVMVMDKNDKLKTNRLALLKTIERMYLEIADFSKIVM